MRKFFLLSFNILHTNPGKYSKIERCKISPEAMEVKSSRYAVPLYSIKALPETDEWRKTIFHYLRRSDAGFV